MAKDSVVAGTKCLSLAGSLYILLSYISVRRRWQLAGLFVFMLVGAVSEMCSLGAAVPFLATVADPVEMANRFPLVNQSIAKLGVTQANPLVLYGALFAVITAFAACIRATLIWATLRISFGLGADIGSQIFRNVLYQSYSWHAAHNSSELLASLEKVNTIVSYVLAPMLQGGAALVMCCGVVGMLLWINAETALIVGATFLFFYITTSVTTKRYLDANSRVVSHNLGRRIKVMQEGVGGIRDILLDGTQSLYVQQFSEVDRAMRRSQSDNGLVAAAPRCIIEAVGVMLMIVLAYWLAGDRGGFAAALPVLGALAIGAQKLLPQMQAVYQSWSNINSSRDQLIDVINLLKKPSGAEFAMTAQNVNPRRESSFVRNVPMIELVDVGFHYKANGPLVLNEISLKIHRGMKVGFVGTTGSGKSTLIDVIMGLLPPSKGRLLIDGNHLCQQSIWGWQKRIAHVPQSIYLADASIEENIAFGVPMEEIDRDKVRVAAGQAQLKDVIEQLPEQYQTWVGERGIRLSGGQRQRIGLARAFYKKAEVLVLDEATSALDYETEAALMESLDRHRDELTILMIAHRVSTLRNCDLVVELAHGSINRVGTYDSLFGNNYI